MLLLNFNEALKPQILDGSCTNEKVDICKSALLHARHNTKPFSKFKFLDGEYREYDMSRLNISKLRDWAIYIALTSSGFSLSVLS